MELQNRLAIALTLIALALGACGDDSANDTTDEGGGSSGNSSDEGSGGSDSSRLRADASASDPNTIDEPAEGDQIEVAGSWSGEFGDEEISSEDWNGAAIVEFDNEDNFAVTQNADDADFDPGKFNKNVWTEPTDDGFFYCTVVFGLDSADEAAADDATADDSDPATGGCGGFPWTQLGPQ
jgi:hypothetical protein